MLDFLPHNYCVQKLLKACARGDIDEVMALLTYGVDVDTEKEVHVL